MSSESFASSETSTPSEEQVWKLIRCSREMASPSFAAWLRVAAFTGLRPGELDALRRANVNLGRSRILVVEQFSQNAHAHAAE
jgi:integrase